MKILAAIAKGGTTLLLLLIIILLLIWFGGEQFHLDKKIRVIAISAVLAIAIILVVIQKLMAVRSALLIEQKLKAQAQEQVASARPDQRADVQAVQTQLDEAIQALKTSRLGKGALYKLPWYMIIGPPGSGKSTALQESGLNFPYTSQGKKGLRGVGGTRNCDWWFTDEGILLDTAGRYTTEIDDRDEWIGFLNLLKQARKHKPINGAMVAVSVSDLLGSTEEQLEAHAKNIRGRVDELTSTLEIVFPVYLLFTKCDLLQGFVEFFEDFSKNDRAQVWGCTLPYAPSAGKPYREIFEEETGKLFKNLSSQRLSSLATERPPLKKQNIFLFPLQFQAGIKKMADFVEALFKPNPFQETSYFRGFYFTSGTQEGTPIDQVIKSMSAAFGLKEDAAPAPAAVDKKSYFINHLFTKIIFPDQTLARTSAKVLKRQKIVHFGTLALSAVGTVLVTIILITAFFGNRSLINSTEAAVAKMKESEKLPPAASLEALDGLRHEIEALDDFDRNGAPIARRWGLYRGNVINPHVRSYYFASLKRIFLVPCGDRIRKELDEIFRKEARTPEDNERLDDLQRVYQMLAGELPAEKERDLLENILSKEGRWLSGVGGQPSPLADRQLKLFLTQLDRKDEWRIPVDKMIINRINTELRQGLWVLQSFREIIDAGKSSFPKVTGERFVSGRGKDLLKFNYSFPGLFTQEGWNDYMKSALKSKAESLARRYKELQIEKDPVKLEAELRELYVRKYGSEWDEFLKGIEVLPFQNMEDCDTKTKTLTDDQSPFIALFKGVWEAQNLRVSDTDVPVIVDLKPLTEARTALIDLQVLVGDFIATTQPGNRVAGSMKEGKLQPFLDGFKKANRGLTTAVNTAPALNRPRMQEILYQVIDKTRASLALEAQKEADEMWANTVAKLYKESIVGRYPFDETSASAVSIAAITLLFNPQTGVFWNKVNDLRILNGLNLESKPLVAFSRDFNSSVKKAESFRQGLFRKDGDRINVPFKVTLKQREGVTHLKFTVGKKEFNHNDRPDNRGDLVWEGEAGASLQIRVAGVDRWHPKEFKDDWGLLRLIASGSPQPSGDKSFACSWDFKITRLGTDQVFVGDVLLEGDDRVNPFQKDFFSKFSVPDKVGP
ncbi:MAG TPA: type VI secretion system membrane subunit TssM [Planctomycetota bacterium]|nr:type VI secretion system membrane subunit TssM [Planctomycetota bacterium]